MRATRPSSNSHRPASREPRWRPLKRYTSQELPAAIRPWLTDDGSLTDRLSGMKRGAFRVQRLFQGWAVPSLSERRSLEVPLRQRAMIREVALMLDNTPVVFARSVFPVRSLAGELGHLRRLRNKSLGAILFQHPGMLRSPFELALVPGQSHYLPGELRQRQTAWGRRSRFDIAGKPLLVSEVFLHTFVPWQTLLPVHRSQRGRVSAALLSATQ
ncbi:MAG: chorismate lyase [Gammaproteobacteria bacterium]|nr:chorismate lyase [Gammaproteobacteria bacterium]